MKLECAETISASNATETDIRKAFADDQGRGEFIILSEAEEVYIQASGESNGPYTLEYREGDARRHFQCTRDLQKGEVEAAFLKYLQRDATWESAFLWTKLEAKPWWKFW